MSALQSLFALPRIGADARRGRAAVPLAARPAQNVTLKASFSAGWLAGRPDELSKTDDTGSSLPDLDKKNVTILVLGCTEADFCKY